MLLQQAGSTKEKVPGKTFEDVIGELDKEINKYDLIGSMAIRVGVNTEKENVGDQHTINEASMPCLPSHATNMSSAPKVPLVEIPCSLVKHGYTEGVWKRIKRMGATEDIGMYEAVGGKRNGDWEINQTELPKKEGFHRGVQQKIRYWQRLATSPIRSNESIIMELSWA